MVINMTIAEKDCFVILNKKAGYLKNSEYTLCAWEIFLKSDDRKR